MTSGEFNMPRKYRHTEQDRNVEFAGLIFIMLIVVASMIVGALVVMSTA